MAASSSDYFTKVGNPGTATTLDAPGHTIGGTSITVISTSNWPTGTGVVFAMDATTIVDGTETRTVGTYTEWEGVVASATSITNMVLRYGSDQNYSAGTSSRVYIPVAGSQNDRMVDGLLAAGLTQAGGMGAIAPTTVTASTSITAPSATFTNLTITGTAVTAGWSALGDVPDTVTYNGNRSYSLVFNGVDHTSTLSNGMRLQTTRTISAPTQCTSLNGTNQYYSKSSPAGMTFTDDFVVSAWVKVSAYPTGTNGMIVSRSNGSSGFDFSITTAGQVQLAGRNGGVGNYSQIISYQSVPLNRWVHIAAQLDMSSFTNSATTSYVMIDGIDAPGAVTRAGTNPTALVQAGNLEIGSWNGGLLPFSGKIAQAAIYNAKVTQANVVATISQGLAGTETSLISAYSFNNSINDLNANANNLTANGSAVATNADSPFAQDDDGVPLGTTDCGIIQSVSFSTNTTVVVQLAEGCTIPTSGGVSTVLYSLQKTPFGFPSDLGRWTLEVLFKGTFTQSSPVSGTWYNMTTTSGTSGGMRMTFPIGYFKQGWDGWVQPTGGASGGSMYVTLSTANNTESDNNLTARNYIQTASIAYGDTFSRSKNIKLTAQTDYYLNAKTDIGSMSTILFGGTQVPARIYAELANL